MSCNQIENNISHKGNLLLLTCTDEMQRSIQEKDVFQVSQLVVLKLSQQIFVPRYLDPAKNSFLNILPSI